MSRLRLHPNSIMILMLAGLTLVPAAYAQSDQRETPKLIRKSGGVLASEAIERVNPTYPPLAKAARVSGSVVVEVTIDHDGNVTSARAVSGHPLLRDPAIAAARGWRFKPTLLSGQPVNVVGIITFNFHLGNEEEINKLKEEIAANPDSAELQFKLGQQYQVGGEHEKAVEAYSEAVRLKPDYAPARYGLGQAYENVSNTDQALYEYNQALDAKPDYLLRAEIYTRVGMLHFGRANYAEARDAFKKAIESNRQLGSAYYRLGQTYLKMQEIQLAAEQYRLLTEINKDLAQVLLMEINNASK